MSATVTEQHVFESISITDLDRLSTAQLDALPFGVVGLSEKGLVEIYNTTEALMAGLPAATVMGSSFFLSTAQCMNNFMVAQRLEDESELDLTLPYVLTFRMRPTPATLRLLKSSLSLRRYILIRR